METVDANGRRRDFQPRVHVVGLTGPLPAGGGVGCGHRWNIKRTSSRSSVACRSEHEDACPPRSARQLSDPCADATPASFPRKFIARLFATVNPLPNLAPTWNMAPTMDAPVVRLVDGERHLDALKWGLVPYFTKDLKKARKPINARSETIAKSGMFKAAFAERRCLVPAPAYYEWRDDPDGKTPFAVARIDGDPVVFGGHLGKVEIAGGRDPADLRDHHDRREPPACRDTGPHAGDHRAGGLAALAGRDRGRSRLSCCARHRRTSCGSGRSGRPSATSGTTGQSCSSQRQWRNQRFSSDKS